MDTLPGITIHSSRPNLRSIFDRVDRESLLFDDGTFNIPSQLHGLSFETVGVLLNSDMIRIFITEDSVSNMYTNKEDIDILRSYVYEPNIPFAEACQRICSEVQTLTIIDHYSPNKEMVKTFWNNFLNRKLK